MRLPVLHSRHQPEILGLAGSSEVPQAVIDRNHRIVGLVNDQQRSRAYFAYHIHRADAIDIDSCSIVGYCDGQRCKRKGGKVNKMFKTRSDYTWRIAESRVVYYSADTFVLCRAENAGGTTHRDAQYADSF